MYKRKDDKELLECVQKENWEEAQVESKGDRDAKVGRIDIITDCWEGNPGKARLVLEKVIEKVEWSGLFRLDVLLTPAGFLRTRKETGKIERPDPKNLSRNALKVLREKAEENVKGLLIENGFAERFRPLTRYLAMGIDVGFCQEERKKKDNVEKTEKGKTTSIHAEFVVLIDLDNPGMDDWWWTGKSYPTSKQENKVHRFWNVETHLKELKKPLGKTLVLCCHDLNAYHPRWNSREKELKDWRLSSRNDFRELARDCHFDIVLHLYHTGWLPQTWNQAWRELNELADSIERYIGCGVISLGEIKKKLKGKKKTGETVEEVIEEILNNTRSKDLKVLNIEVKGKS